MKELFENLVRDNPWITNLIWSFVALVVGIILYLLITRLFLNKLEGKSRRIFKGRRSDTYVKLFRSINRYLFFVILVLVILRINGVNITAMATGVGVVGIIFGFAIQDALKDIIKGIDIMADSYFHVGDVIREGKYTGQVLTIGIKTTKLEDVYEKNIVSISNRNIEEVEVLSHMINIDVPLPYELKSDEAERVIGTVLSALGDMDKVEKAEYRGVNDFADSSVKYHIKVYCAPADKVQVRRDALSCVQRCLEASDVHIPFMQVDIHQK